MHDWLEDYGFPSVIGILATVILSVLTSAITLHYIVSILSRDTLEVPVRPSTSLKGRLVKVGTNIAAVTLILLGTALLVLPGEGILTILLGILLLDFPGRQRLLQRFTRIQRVSDTLTWLQAAHLVEGRRSPLSNSFSHVPPPAPSAGSGNAGQLAPSPSIYDSSSKEHGARQPGEDPVHEAL